MINEQQKIQIGRCALSIADYIRFLDSIDSGKRSVSDYTFVSDVFAIALYFNRQSVLNQIFDLCHISKTLSFKQRIALYQLLETKP